MHWFYRGMIAICGATPATALLLMLPGLWKPHIKSDLSLTGATVIAAGMIVGPALAVYGFVTRRFPPEATIDRETRCRKCEYILRGISEPRCPECGERI